MAVRTLTGGADLEAALRELGKKIGHDGSVRVGFLEGATEADGTSVPMIAAIQEFGAPSQGIPPRPFFRSMIADKSPGWGKALAGLLKGGADVPTAMGQMGMGIKGQLQQSIVDLTDPPLAPATVVAKGASKPLVDTGTMLNSVDYEVEA